MDSKHAEEEPRTDTDDTVAWSKKRGRRVSFAAEMTSVRVFDRDDDNLETPPEPRSDLDDDVPGFFNDLEGDTDDESRERSRTDDDVCGVGRQPFLQPFESPSSASAIASATSNDADDYFGPVSSEFIRPGRLSPSVASDDNHEITMDSTAFSMHFRSLAKSDSGYLKTPTGSPLLFEEKTHTPSGTATVQESSMELTRYDESLYHISVPGYKFSSGKDSNDMSILEDNPRKFDYASMSPRLDEDELISVGSKFRGTSPSEFSTEVSDTSRLPILIPFEKSFSTSINVRYPSEEKKLAGLDLNKVASLSNTPVAGDGSLRSNLACCIKKTPQHDMPVTNLEDQFFGIDPQPNIQKMPDNMNEDAFTPSEAGVSSLNATPLVDNSTIRSKLSSCLLKTPQHGTLVSRLEEHFITIGQEHSIQKMTADKDFNQFIITEDRKDSNSYHRVTNPPPLKKFCDKTNIKSEKTIEKILPYENSPVFKSPSRFQDSMQLDLNQQSPDDKVIDVSPANGELMEIISSGSYLNVMAQKLDNMFVEKNQYSRSPVKMIDQERGPLQVHSLLSKDSSGLLQNTEFLRSPLKIDAIISSDGNSGSSGAPFNPHAHASGDQSLITVQAPTNVSSPGAFEEYVTNLKAPESNMHKRGHNQIVTGDQLSALNVDKPRSPKIQKKAINVSLRHNNFYDAESRCRSILAPKHWSAIFSDALANSEQSFSTSFDRLDLHKIELLEDVLIQLQKVQKVTVICGGIQTQRVGNHMNMERNRRIFKTKELLQNMLLERAKLKLVGVKIEKLWERVETVRSGIQRCQTMNLNCSQLRACVKCNAKSVHCDPQPLTVQLEGQQNLQVANHEIPEMKRKVSVTQREIDALMYSFYTCFKMKEKCTNVDTITLVNDCIKRRALFKSFREDVQLWEINNIVCKNDQSKISLNYHGYLIQWFTHVAPLSNMTVSYVVNRSNIEKKYPCMEAHTAFSYLFKDEVEQKYVGIRSLARETQVTSAILSSLLDVIEEVKLARLEFKQLREAKFRSPPAAARKLVLCLQFVDFKTGMKTDLTLDVSCLSWGVYPSDVFPSQVQPYTRLKVNSFSTGLQAAVESLKFGSLRILRICRCVSTVLASPSTKEPHSE